MNRQSKTERIKLLICGLGLTAFAVFVVFSSITRSGAQGNDGPTATDAPATPATGNAAAAPVPAAAPVVKTPAQDPAPPAAAPKMEGCIACHGNIEPMHRKRGTKPEESGKLDEQGKDAFGLSCTYCHGGNPATLEKKEAHVKPRYPELWQRYKKQDTTSSANPENSHALMANESYEFVRFVNPADLRVADNGVRRAADMESAAIAR